MADYGNWAAAFKAPPPINTVGQNMNQAIGNVQGMQTIQGNSYSNALNQIAVQNAQDDQAFQATLNSIFGTPADPTQAASNFLTAPGGQAASPDASTGSADAPAAPAITGMPVGPGGANPVFPGGVGGGQPMNQVASQYANQGGANPATIAGPGAPQGQPGAGPQPSPQAPSPTGAPSMPGQPMNTAAEAPQGQPGAASGGGQPQQSMNDILARTPPRLRVRMYNWLMQKQAEAQKAEQENLKAWAPIYEKIKEAGDDPGMQAFLKVAANQPGSVGKFAQAHIDANYHTTPSGDETVTISYPNTEEGRKGLADRKAALSKEYENNPDAVRAISDMTVGNEYKYKRNKNKSFGGITKGSGGGLDATQRLIKGVVEEQLDKNGISRDATKSEIAEGLVALKQSEKMDSPEREGQVVRETGAKAYSGEKSREEAQKMDPADAQEMGKQYVMTGTMPQGLGLGGIALKKQIVHEGLLWAKQNGMNDVNLALKQLQYKADQSSLTKTENIAAMTENYEKTVESYIPMLKEQQKAVARVPIKSIAELQMRVEKDMIGDPDAKAFYGTLYELLVDYSKVVTGNFGMAGLTDSARQEGAKLLSVADKPETFNKVLDNFQALMNKRTGALKDTANGILAKYNLSPQAKKAGSTTDSVRPKNKNFDQAVGYLKAASDRTDAIKRASSLKARGWSREDLNAIGEQAGY